jgi:hypothetical protein
MYFALVDMYDQIVKTDNSSTITLGIKSEGVEFSTVF